MAEAHLTDVQVRIADLKRMERVLRATIRRCAVGGRTGCPMIDALYRNQHDPGVR